MMGRQGRQRLSVDVNAGVRWMQARTWAGDAGAGWRFSVLGKVRGALWASSSSTGSRPLQTLVQTATTSVVPE